MEGTSPIPERRPDSRGRSTLQNRMGRLALGGLDLFPNPLAWEANPSLARGSAEVHEGVGRPHEAANGRNVASMEGLLCQSTANIPTGPIGRIRQLPEQAAPSEGNAGEEKIGENGKEKFEKQKKKGGNVEKMIM